MNHQCDLKQNFIASRLVVSKVSFTISPMHCKAFDSQFAAHLKSESKFDNVSCIYLAAREVPHGFCKYSFRREQSQIACIVEKVCYSLNCY